MIKNRRTQTFIAAFIITVILICALCGFVAVDLSTDRYMPGRFGPLFEISGIDINGTNFTLMAQTYRLDFSNTHKIIAVLGKYKGLLPLSPQIGSAATATGYKYFSSLLQEPRD